MEGKIQCSTGHGYGYIQFGHGYWFSTDKICSHQKNMRLFGANFGRFGATLIKLFMRSYLDYETFFRTQDFKKGQQKS